MAGFKTLTQTGLVLAVGQQLSLALRIEVGQINETVNVTAATPLPDTSSVSSGQNFDSRMVEGLPMFSNMPIMLTRFASGVNPSTNQSLVSQGFADGTTHIRNVWNWRVKETDRLSAMATELRKLGAQVDEGRDSISITPPTRLRSAVIDTYDDHRMAMAFSLAALGDVPITINDPDCVAKTFPEYFQVFASLCR